MVEIGVVVAELGGRSEHLAVRGGLQLRVALADEKEWQVSYAVEDLLVGGFWHVAEGPPRFRQPPNAHPVDSAVYVVLALDSGVNLWEVAGGGDAVAGHHVQQVEQRVICYVSEEQRLVHAALGKGEQRANRKSVGRLGFLQCN